jgi:hypothetical protein
MPFTERRTNMQYYVSNTNFSSGRAPIEVNDDRTHDASRSSKTRLIWLRPDSQFPCGALFPRAKTVAFGKDSIEKVLGVKYLLGTGTEMDPDGPARIASAAIADAIRDRKKAYHRFMARQRLSHKLMIPPELLQ